MATKKSTKKAAAKKETPKESEKVEKNGVDISETLKSIKTKFGDDAIMTLGETKKVDVDAVPTG